MITTHIVRVLGRELQLKSSSTPEHVAQVEALVNAKLAEAQAAVASGDSQLVIILAMMNLAEASLEAQKQVEAERTISRTRLAELIGQLDRHTA